MQTKYADVTEKFTEGILVPPVVPWDTEYDLDEEAFADHIRNLSSSGVVSGFVCNAHSGEGEMIPWELRRDILDVCQRITDDLPVFSGVFSDSTRIAAAEAADAEAAGADGIMLYPSHIFAEGDCPAELVVDHYEAVANRIDIPIIALQFPTTGGEIPVTALERICAMDDVVAFKDGSFDPVTYEETVRRLEPRRDEFVLINGNDTFIYHAQRLGADTSLLLYSNVLIEKQAELMDAVDEGRIERARSLREQLLPMTNFIFKDPIRDCRARVKEALVMTGVFDHGRVLPPQRPLDDSDRAELRDILTALGAV
jgi:4-hydroxy-tetrahydrodipicolinate synthase